MQKKTRILTTLTVLGMALVALVAFAPDGLSWQQVAHAEEPPDVEVSIEGFAFVPDSVLVSAGTTVRWTNNDQVPHTVTSATAGLFDSGTLQPGESFEHRFDLPGSYTYLCKIHPFMAGTVIVSDQAFAVYLPFVAR